MIDIDRPDTDKAPKMQAIVDDVRESLQAPYLRITNPKGETMLSVITQYGMIRSKHPIREDFSGCPMGSPVGSSRIGHYGTKGHAVMAYSNTLAKYGLCFDGDSPFDISGDDGRITVNIRQDKRGYTLCVGFAILTWHKMPSGDYEFLGYLA